MAAFQDKAVENRLHSSRARIVTPTEGCIRLAVFNTRCIQNILKQTAGF